MEERRNVKYEESEMTIDLVEMAGYLLRRAFYIVFTTALIGILAFGYSVKFIAPQYSSDIMVYVNNVSSLGEIAARVTGSDLSASESLVRTYTTILKNRETLEMVIEEADLDLTYRALGSMISTTSVSGTPILQVTATTSDPLLSAKIANAISDILPVRISQIVDGSSVSRISGAIPNTVPVSPNVRKNTMMGAVAGFVLSVGVLVMMFLMDIQIHSEKYLTSEYPDIPLLTIVPNMNSAEKKGYAYYKNNSYAQKR